MTCGIARSHLTSQSHRLSCGASSPSTGTGYDTGASLLRLQAPSHRPRVRASVVDADQQPASGDVGVDLQRALGHAIPRAVVADPGPRGLAYTPAKLGVCQHA